VSLPSIGKIYNKNEDTILTQGIIRLASESKSFDFLEIEEDIYTIDDIKG